MALLSAAGKEPVHVRHDCVPGNRLQHALWREAIALVDEGVCTPEDVDTIVKRSFALRLAVLGPLENADLVGLELTRQVHEVVLPTLSRATAPSPSLLGRIATGDTGVAAGAGFYSGWTPVIVEALRDRLARHLSGSIAGAGGLTLGHRSRARSCGAQRARRQHGDQQPDPRRHHLGTRPATAIDTARTDRNNPADVAGGACGDVLDDPGPDRDRARAGSATAPCRCSTGRAGDRGWYRWLPQNLVLRAAVLAVIAWLLLVPAGLIFVALLAILPMTRTTMLLFNLLFGAVIGIVMTRPVVLAALADGRPR